MNFHFSSFFCYTQIQSNCITKDINEMASYNPYMLGFLALLQVIFLAGAASTTCPLWTTKAKAYPNKVIAGQSTLKVSIDIMLYKRRGPLNNAILQLALPHGVNLGSVSDSLKSSHITVAQEGSNVIISDAVFTSQKKRTFTFYLNVGSCAVAGPLTFQAVVQLIDEEGNEYCRTPISMTSLKVKD